MQSFYFAGDRGLFGVLHPPARDKAPAPVVVMCAPLWREALRAHRVLRQLATRLANEGNAVLRFDYCGAGDSAGDSEHGDVKSWLGDVAAAIDEAKRARGAAHVTLLGLRFGATLAALAAAKREDVDRLVLWEPVDDGAKYLEEGFADQRAWRARYAQWRRLPPAAVSDDGDEILGFRVTAAMRRSIATVRLAELPRTPPHVLMVERAARDEAGAAGVLERLGARVQHEVLAEPEIWKPQAVAATAGAHKTQQLISSWLSRSTS